MKNFLVFTLERARRAELDSETLPDFAALTSPRLLKLMEQRGIPRKGLNLKAQYVEALTN